MATPDIDFKLIRLHRETKADAFEELCCQLARDDAEAGGLPLNRKGRGADAGVEAFAILPSGDEVGWQVKYYWSIDTLLSSLTASLATALAKHPRLTKFVACFPFDLADSRKSATTRTARRKWDEWEANEIAKAASLGRRLTIERWDASELKDRLTRNSMASGRIAFWFDQTLFDRSWFNDRFDRAKKALDSRYTAETHIDLPIRRAILATTRDQVFVNELRSYEDGLAGLMSRLPITGKPSEARARSAVAEAITALIAAAHTNDMDIPVAALLNKLKTSQTLVHTWREELRDDKTTRETDDTRIVSSLYSRITEIIKDFGLPRWQLINSRRILVFGDGGRGKSHLLADACSHQVSRGFPAIFILSNTLRHGEPWKQIISDLDLPVHVRRVEFLSALNSAAQACGVRALIVVDGINERDGQTIWSTHLATFLNDAEAFHWITIVLSCRTTYLHQTVPSGIGEAYLPRLEHDGFSIADAERYLDLRCVSTLEAPWPLEEFRTPLFLKTLCDGLIVAGETTLPKGSSGLTAIFDLYAKAITDKVDRDLKLNPRLHQVDRAIKAVAEEISTTGDTFVIYSRASEIVSAILPGDGTHERDLLFQLIAGGILSIDQIGANEFVRFTFERYGDYAHARGLLDRSVMGGNLAAALSSATPLAGLFSSEIWRLQGVIEALAVLVPELYGIELPDAVTESADHFVIEEAFTASLRTRAVKAYTIRTWEIIRTIGDEGLKFETLIHLSTDPDSNFNAERLHEALIVQKMAERDAGWSIHIAQNSDLAVRLINWVIEADMKRVAHDRAELAATVLACFFTTTNRAIRDRATKALALVLAAHPACIKSLLSQFASIDDAYVFERVLASIYGAAMQGRWDEESATIAATEVYECVFASKNPPVNVLTRDHANKFIAWARHVKALSEDFDTSDALPPYNSSWPLEHISDATIATYVQEYRNGYIGKDQIVGSCVNDGDFARYVLDSAVLKWAPAPRGSKRLPTRKNLHDRWENDFRKVATSEQLAAYSALESAIAVLPREHWISSKQTEAYESAKLVFASTLSPDMYERWREEAENWRRHGMYQGFASRDHADFNLAWARRWVCWRAHDLGWTSNLHGEFDRSIHNDRMTHDVERIGKKYQWLALYELIARMSDNLRPVDHTTLLEPENLRNVDPSLIAGSRVLAEEDEDLPQQITDPSRRGPVIVLPSVGVDEALAWRDVSDDLPDQISDIEFAGDTDGDGWLVLKAFDLWRGGPERLRRELSRWVTCVVVSRRSRGAFLDLVENETQIDHDSFGRDDRVPWHSYLGEHPWCWIADRDADGWIAGWKPRGDTTIRKGVRIRNTTLGYLAETGAYDHSIRTNIDARLPERWLIDALGLHLVDGRNVVYADAAGREIFADRTATSGGSTSALIRRESFLAMLKHERLSAIWLTGGEKNVYGTSNSEGFGGRRHYFSLIWSDGGPLQAGRRSWNLEEPSRSQIEALRSDNP